MALDRPFDDGHRGVQITSGCLSTKYNGRFSLHAQGKTIFISPTYVIDETAETSVSDERGKTAEEAPKRAETWRGGLK